MLHVKILRLNKVRVTLTYKKAKGCLSITVERIEVSEDTRMKVEESRLDRAVEELCHIDSAFYLLSVGFGCPDKSVIIP